MAAAEKKNSLALIFGEGGGGKKPPLPAPKDEPDGDEAPEVESDSGMDDPAYDSAFNDMKAELDGGGLTKESFWRAVKACMGSY